MKYLVTGGVLSAPGGAFYLGTEVEASDLGIPQSRIEYLVEQGVIEEVAAEQAAVSTPVTPTTPPVIDTPEKALAALDKAVGADTAKALREAGLATVSETAVGLSGNDDELLAVPGMTEPKLKKLKVWFLGLAGTTWAPAQ